MARFVFELEAVLTERKAAERRKQLAVAALERERSGMEQLIRECQQGILSAREALREQLDPGRAVDLHSVRLQAGASLHLVARAQKAVLELAGIHRRIDAARLDLLRAAVRRKAVEALRDRRFEEWRTDQRRREHAALDELSVMRAGRTEADE
ncbi:hypothetical protein PHYC_02784 [Phycisphaerales bacterium]|nr:hypothetical protein PHYC_02784 [Phycisphaerales bacterium]